MSQPQPLCNLSLDVSPPRPAVSRAAPGSPREERGARLSTQGGPGKAAAGSTGLAKQAPVGMWERHPWLQGPQAHAVG